MSGVLPFSSLVGDSQEREEDSSTHARALCLRGVSSSLGCVGFGSQGFFPQLVPL